MPVRKSQKVTIFESRPGVAYPCLRTERILIRRTRKLVDGDKHEATASLTGYLFQCRCALLKGLQAIPKSPELEISIEKFDDIAFETASEPIELIQTKHHVGRKGNLSDGSVDLWKTLSIWSDLVKKNVEAPFRLKFMLLTTAAAPDGSAASYLRLRDRNEEAADKRLLQIAGQSKNKANADAYEIYQSLPDDLRYRGNL